MSVRFSFIEAALIGQLVTAGLWAALIVAYSDGHAGDVNGLLAFLAYAVPSSIIGALIHLLGEGKA